MTKTVKERLTALETSMTWVKALLAINVAASLTEIFILWGNGVVT